MITKEEILVIVVNYNQENEIENFLFNLKFHWPINQTLVVDDGSKDKSVQLAEKLDFKVIRHDINRGVGAAIRTGLIEAKQKSWKAIVIMPSNGKTRAEEIKNLIAPVIGGQADYVTGSRFLPGGSSPGITKFRRVAIPVISIFLSIILGRRFSDITCGFRCYKIDFLFENPVRIDQPWLDRYELEYYIHFWACEKKIKIVEMPVTIPYTHLSKKRISKIRPFIDWWKMITPILYLRLGIRK